MLVVGGREEAQRAVSIRVRTGEKSDLPLDEAIMMIQKKIDDREMP